MILDSDFLTIAEYEIHLGSYMTDFKVKNTSLVYRKRDDCLFISLFSDRFPGFRVLMIKGAVTLQKEELDVDTPHYSKEFEHLEGRVPHYQYFSKMVE